MSLMPEELLEEVLLWEAEDEEIMRKLRELEEMMLMMEVEE